MCCVLQGGRRDGVAHVNAAGIGCHLRYSLAQYLTLRFRRSLIISSHALTQEHSSQLTSAPTCPAASAVSEYASKAKESASATAAQLYGSGTKAADKAYEAAATATPGTKTGVY